MRNQHQSCFFILLLAITVVPTHASSLLSLQQSKNPETSLKTCTNHLKSLQTNWNLSYLLSNDCREMLEHILRNTPSLPLHPSKMIFGSRSNDAYKYSKKPATFAADGHNSGYDSVTGNHGTSQVYENNSRRTDPQFSVPKSRKNSFNKLAIRRTLSQAWNNPDDIYVDPYRHHFVKSIVHPIQRISVSKNDLKPVRNFVSKLMYAENIPKLYHQVRNVKKDVNNEKAQKDELMSVLYGMQSWKDMAQVKKRVPGNWLKVNTEVAKRQTLSINNALMALTNMVLEQGREKMMRNRNNLRYHMYIQG